MLKEEQNTWRIRARKRLVIFVRGSAITPLAANLDGPIAQARIPKICFTGHRPKF